MKPVLVYPGSKQDFYPEIRERIPRDIRVWCEAFMGGGSTTLNILGDMEFGVEKVVVGDFSHRVAAFWRSILERPDDLADAFDHLLTPFTKTVMQLGERQQAYDDFEWFGKLKGDDKGGDPERYARVVAVRKELLRQHTELTDMETDDTLTIAAQMSLLHQISFSGVAFCGGLSYQRIVKLKPGSRHELFKQASKLLNAASAEVLHGDFADTCDKVVGEDGAFIYLDPPYYVQAKGIYEKGTFDHERLAEYLYGIKDKTHFLLSYDDCVPIRQLYKKGNLNVDTYKLPRGYTMAGAASAENALDGEELFISNYEL